MLSRKLAKQLARVLRGESENRGKRSIAQTLERAQAKGFSRCLIIFEEHGNPSKLCFLEEGQWLPAILVKSVSFEEKEGSEAGKKRRLPGLREIVAEDAEGERIKQLFETPEAVEKMSENHGGMEMRASAAEISFWLQGEKIAPAIKISGIEEPQNTDEDQGE